MNDIVKLPRVTKLHPLVSAYATIGFTQASLAKFVGVTQQTVQEWLAAARADRDFQVPPRRVPALCKLTSQPPYLYNPELWPDRTWRFK